MWKVVDRLLDTYMIYDTRMPCAVVGVVRLLTIGRHGMYSVQCTALKVVIRGGAKCAF